MNSKGKHKSLWQNFAHEFLLNGDGVTNSQQYKYLRSIIYMAMSFLITVILASIKCFLGSLITFMAFIWILYKSYHYIVQCEDSGLLVDHHRIIESNIISIITTPTIYTASYLLIKSYIPTQSVFMFIFCLLSLKYASNIDDKRRLLDKLNELQQTIDSISRFNGIISINNLKDSLKSNIANASNIDDISKISQSLSDNIYSMKSKSTNANEYRSNVDNAISLLDRTNLLCKESRNKASLASNDANSAINLLNKNKK